MFILPTLKIIIQSTQFKSFLKSIMVEMMVFYISSRNNKKKKKKKKILQPYPKCELKIINNNLYSNIIMIKNF